MPIDYNFILSQYNQSQQRQQQQQQAQREYAMQQADQVAKQMRDTWTQQHQTNLDEQAAANAKEAARWHDLVDTAKGNVLGFKKEDAATKAGLRQKGFDSREFIAQLQNATRLVTGAGLTPNQGLQTIQGYGQGLRNFQQAPPIGETAPTVNSSLQPPPPQGVAPIPEAQGPNGAPIAPPVQPAQAPVNPLEFMNALPPAMQLKKDAETRRSERSNVMNEVDRQKTTTQGLLAAANVAVKNAEVLLKGSQRAAIDKKLPYEVQLLISRDANQRAEMMSRDRAHDIQQQREDRLEAFDNFRMNQASNAAPDKIVKGENDARNQMIKHQDELAKQIQALRTLQESAAIAAKPDPNDPKQVAAAQILNNPEVKASNDALLMQLNDSIPELKKTIEHDRTERDYFIQLGKDKGARVPTSSGGSWKSGSQYGKQEFDPPKTDLYNGRPYTDPTTGRSFVYDEPNKKWVPTAAVDGSAVTVPKADAAKPRNRSTSPAQRSNPGKGGLSGGKKRTLPDGTVITVK